MNVTELSSWELGKIEVEYPVYQASVEAKSFNLSVEVSTPSFKLSQAFSLAFLSSSNFVCASSTCNSSD